MTMIQPPKAQIKTKKAFTRCLPVETQARRPACGDSQSFREPTFRRHRQKQKKFNPTCVFWSTPDRRIQRGGPQKGWLKGEMLKQKAAWAGRAEAIYE